MNHAPLPTNATFAQPHHVPAASRGRADFGWLQSFHSFSFGEYYDPARMGYGVLRVLNDDTVAGGGGFPPHPHRDMEIISYVLEGGLAHRDSSGGEGVIQPDELQVMTAGTGVTHSEYNASATAPVKFLQLWLLPKAKGLAPRYAQAAFAAPQGWQPLASPTGVPGGLQLQAEASLWRAKPHAGETLPPLTLPQGAWLQVIDGTVSVNGQAASAGDGLALPSGELTVQASADAHLLLVVME
ncbi:MAG: pirin family protein [Alphaproteobacteria bacterium]|nr:pirin family protein [Alphaproteobacteria bacterium]